MSIKGYELMKLASEEPTKYKGKMYKIVYGTVMTNEVAYDREIKIDGDGELVTLTDLRLYISGLVKLEEIKQPVSGQGSSKGIL